MSEAGVGDPLETAVRSHVRDVAPLPPLCLTEINKREKELVRGGGSGTSMRAGGTWATSGGPGLQQDTSIVWLTWPSPSLLSECVQACGRLPSTELALVRDAVRERARRVMLAEGTAGRRGTRREGRQAGPGTGKREGSRKQSGQRDSFFRRHGGPVRGCGVCSVKPKACNSATVREPKGWGPGPTGTSLTLSPQLARATARAGWVGVDGVSPSWCKDSSRFQQCLSREDGGAGGAG